MIGITALHRIKITGIILAILPVISIGLLSYLNEWKHFTLAIILIFISSSVAIFQRKSYISVVDEQDRINNQLNTTYMNLANNQALLKEYKKAVDNSAIVSKTDISGVITYVNKEFCKVSGYNEDELIGKSHNIIRHPDMLKSSFKEMWNCIKKEKKSWRGIVKNRTKLGKSYWVDAFITPIINYEGDIVEFIAIRYEITELHKLKEYLQKELNIKNKSLKESMRLASEYEHAIEESNILSRTDLNGNITYVNREFCRVSGYSKDELITKSHNLIRHPDNPESMFESLWNTIKSGEVWKGIIKNRARNGQDYYVNSTVFPIKNSDGQIIEYMGIRHNITEIMELHKEIEDTQKEVIYRMGEVAESRSKETGYHIKRVAEYSKLLALLSGISEKDSELLFLASPMHDIGKVGIPDSILNKPGKLNANEWEIMKKHTTIGFNILKDSNRDILRIASIISLQHHEKYDGSGYPNALKGENIHIFGRITAIADVFDALGSDRCYKQAWGFDEILTLFREERGKHFDPKLIDVFFANLDKFLEIRDNYIDKSCEI